MLMAIPAPLAMLGRTYFYDPQFRDGVFFFFFFYTISFVVIAVLGSVVFSLLLFTKKLNKKNSCFFGWLVATTLSIPSSDIGVDQIVNFFFMMFNGALGAGFFGCSGRAAKSACSTRRISLSALRVVAGLLNHAPVLMPA